MILKIKKSKSGTYYIPSLSIKELKALSKRENRIWVLTKDLKKLILVAGESSCQSETGLTGQFISRNE